MRHVIRLTRKEPWDPLYHVLVSDAPRALDINAEIRNGHAQLRQTGTVGSKPGTYPVSLVAVDPSGNESAPVELDVVRE